MDHVYKYVMSYDVVINAVAVNSDFFIVTILGFEFYNNFNDFTVMLDTT